MLSCPRRKRYVLASHVWQQFGPNVVEMINVMQTFAKHVKGKLKTFIEFTMAFRDLFF
jgi:hypothetical protein